MQAQFQAAAFSHLQQANENDYVNARYAPIGNQTVGMPFPLFRQPAGYFTDWTPAGQGSSNYKRRMNLPTDNTLFRNTQQADAVNLASKQNNAFVFRTQTLTNNGDPIACRNNTDCASWPGTTCNGQFSQWDVSYGNQGNYCAITRYPELSSGTYMRKNIDEGGIGKSCSSDNECGTGYQCRNNAGMFGDSYQQGFCAQTYSCSDGKAHYLEYPAGSGRPTPPAPNQNNGGRGYSSEEECRTNKLAQQDCRQDSSKAWFATYPGYCPVVTNLRSGTQPAGMLPTSSMVSQDSGITMPTYATSSGSTIGKPLAAFTSWNINASPDNSHQMSDPMSYELAINPR
jgi:hypothetical protein